jgi:hypothetical protein
MAGITNTSSFGKALWPGINTWYGKAYNEFKVEYTDLFDTYKTSQHYEEDVGVVSFGLAKKKAEGAPVEYEGESQGFITRYQPDEYALGFIITEIMMEDDLYGVAGERKSKGLAFSMRQTKEIVGANVYNRAFDSNYVGGDGLELCSASHLNYSGGTWSNLATSVISELALEQGVIAMGKWTTDKGMRISVTPECIVIPVDLQFDVKRILDSNLRVGTSDNDLNALASMGNFPKGVKVNHYLTDPDAWFIRTNVQDGMKYFERRADYFKHDEDFDTSNAKFKCAGRYVFGWTDPRTMYGSAGV